MVVVGFFGVWAHLPVVNVDVRGGEVAVGANTQLLLKILDKITVPRLDLQLISVLQDDFSSGSFDLLAESFVIESCIFNQGFFVLSSRGLQFDLLLEVFLLHHAVLEAVLDFLRLPLPKSVSFNHLLFEFRRPRMPLLRLGQLLGLSLRLVHNHVVRIRRHLVTLALNRDGRDMSSILIQYHLLVQVPQTAGACRVAFVSGEGGDALHVLGVRHVEPLRLSL